MKKITVLQISSRADRSGGPKHLLDLLKSINNAALEIHGAFPLDQDFSAPISNFCKSSIHLPQRNFSLNKFIELYNYCKNNQIEIIHSHGRGAGIYSRLLSITNAKIVHTFHGVHNERTIVGQLKVFADRILKKLTHKFIFVSNDEMVQGLSLKLAFPRKSRVIFNGVDKEDIYKNSLSDINLKETLNISSEIKIIGSIGRLTYQKGYDLLILLLNRNKEIFSKYHFLIGGPGEDLKKLEELKKKLNVVNITFLGELKNPYPFLSKIDYYLSSSRWEGLPLTVLEAFALKKPCILTDVPGHKDFQRYAQYYNLDDPLSLEKALENATPLQHFPKEFTLINMRNEVERTYINRFY